MVYTRALTICLTILAIIALACGAESSKSQKERKKGREGAPDLQVIDVQYFQGAVSAPSTELPATLFKTTVRNNTGDRTITGILWKIEIYDATGAKKLEELEPYIRLDAYKPGITMAIPAGASVPLSFYAQRTVAADRPSIKASIQNYVYKEYTGDQSRGEGSQVYAAEKWPFESKSEPVLEGKSK